MVKSILEKIQLRVAIRFSYRLSSHGEDHREKKEMGAGGSQKKRARRGTRDNLQGRAGLGNINISRKHSQRKVSSGVGLG